MDRLRGQVDEWRQTQKSSLGKLDSSEYSALSASIHQFEKFTEEMYQILHSESAEGVSQYTELKPIVDEFEKELQLKQHLAILLDSNTLPTAQTELLKALWKTQPYIYAIINRN